MTGSGILLYLPPVYHAPVRSQPPSPQFLSGPHPYPVSFVHVHFLHLSIFPVLIYFFTISFAAILHRYLISPDSKFLPCQASRCTPYNLSRGPGHVWSTYHTSRSLLLGCIPLWRTHDNAQFTQYSLECTSYRIKKYHIFTYETLWDSYQSHRRF